MYALDGTARAAAPYTVTERIAALREESPPTAAEAGRRRIFFPHLVAERTTQWERGDDPLTRIELTDDYDEWGQPCRRTRTALPRRSALRRPGGSAAGGDEDRVLATYTLTEFAVPDNGLHLRDRVAHERTFVLAAPPGVTETDPTDTAVVVTDQATAARDVDLAFRTLLQAWQPGDLVPNGLELIGHVVTHYDGGPARAFRGRNLGKVGPYGVVVRTETLAFTSDLLDAAYGAQRPAYLDGPETPPGGAPAGFGTGVGYRLRQRSADGYHDGYYADRERMKLDFHIAGRNGSARADARGPGPARAGDRLRLRCVRLPPHPGDGRGRADGRGEARLPGAPAGVAHRPERQPHAVRVHAARPARVDHAAREGRCRRGRLGSCEPPVRLRLRVDSDLGTHDSVRPPRHRAGPVGRSARGVSREGGVLGRLRPPRPGSGAGGGRPVRPAWEHTAVRRLGARRRPVAGGRAGIRSASGSERRR